MTGWAASCLPPAASRNSREARWTVARLDDPLWQRIGYSPTGSGGVSALTTFDDGVGPRLFAGGNFCRA